MATILQETEIGHEAIAPDVAPFERIANRVNGNVDVFMGKMAVVGSFDTDNDALLGIYGGRTARDLYARGIIGHDNVLGLRVLLPREVSPSYETEIERGRLMATVRGLREGILSRNPSKENDEPDYYHTSINHGSLRPAEVSLFGQEVIDRFQMEFVLRKAWEDFDSSVNRGVHRDVPREKRSLVIVTSPRIGAKLDRRIEPENLLFGGIATLYRTTSQEMWLPFQRPLVNLESKMPIERPKSSQAG